MNGLEAGYRGLGPDFYGKSYYDTIVLTSADRISGTPDDCIIPLAPTIRLSTADELLLQGFQWNWTSPTGTINPQYNAIPFQEAASGGPVVVFIPSGSYIYFSFLAAVARAMTAASPNHYTYLYATTGLRSVITASGGGTFKFLWRSAESLGLCPVNQEASYAMGYGYPVTSSDTGYANSQTSPSIINLSGPAGFQISLTAPATITTGIVTTSSGQPGTYYASLGISSLSGGFFDPNQQVGGRIKIKGDNLGALNGIGVQIYTQKDYPYYPLDTLNDWRLVLVVRRSAE